MSDIFLSYSRKDFNKVKAIKDELERELGVSCWMDLEGIGYTSPSFVTALIKAINESPVFCFMLSANSQVSEYALSEIAHAKDKDKPLFLLNIDKCKLTEEFAFMYRYTNMCDYADPVQKEKLFRELRQQLNLHPNPTPSNGIFGHAYVDMGLSVKWATCNVGATNPEDYGEYFAWGETNTKAVYSEDTYVHCETKKGLFGNVYYHYDRMADIGGDSRYDVARARWGGSWRMPTKSELEELNNRCQWQWTTVNGVAGYKVTGPNGNSIFLPAAGCREGSNLYGIGLDGGYWSSTPGEDYDSGAYDLGFYYKIVLWCSRTHGQSVRPVSE